jgi:hypothetical protein
MAKQNFDRATADNAGNVDGALCSRCGKTVNLENGDIPTDIKNEECRPEDFSQAPLGS